MLAKGGESAKIANLPKLNEDVDSDFDADLESDDDDI